MPQCFLCEADAVIYCINEKANLCGSCDAQVHADNPIARLHKRKWLCNICNKAPAAFECSESGRYYCSPCNASHPTDRQHPRIQGGDVLASIDANARDPKPFGLHASQSLGYPGSQNTLTAGSSSSANPGYSTQAPQNNFLPLYANNTTTNNHSSSSSNGIYDAASHPILGALHQQQTLPRQPLDEEPFSYWNELLYARSHAAANQRRQPDTGRRQQLGSSSKDTQAGPSNYKQTPSVTGSRPGDVLVGIPAKKDKISKGADASGKGGAASNGTSNTASVMGNPTKNGIYTTAPSKIFAQEATANGSAPSPDSLTLHQTSSGNGSILQQSAQQSIANGTSSGSGAASSFVLPPRTQVKTCTNSKDEASKEKNRQVKLDRYREKKKSRKFEKTVRYASRRAFAQARARVNGRFARRSDFPLPDTAS